MKLEFKDTTSGEVIFEREFLPTQEAFWEDQSRYILYSGGVGSGKSFIMLLRVIFECMSQTGSYFLVGRTTYQEIHDVLIKEFMEICHESWIKEYRKTPHPTVILHTFDGGTSEIIFRNLDGMSKGELLGLNLSGFAIDQAEDITREIFLTLKGRLRRKKRDGSDFNHRVFMTSNPKLSWLYEDFKKNPEDNYRLFEASTLENTKNLPAEYVADLLKYPESWRRQYVEGVWDESLLSDNMVFAREHIEMLQRGVHAPLRETEGLKIFKEYDPKHHYQMGIDCAEGAESTEDSLKKSQKDSGVIKIWDHTTDEEVAHYSAKIPPRVLAEKAVNFAALYGNPEIIPEMNSMGLALIDKLDEMGYSNVYRRKEFDRVLKKSMKKVGWRTTAASKQLLISHFEELLRKRKPRVYSLSTVTEFKTFVYSNEAKKKGAGAMDGFHDDEVMALLLASFDEEPVRESRVVSPGAGQGGIIIASDGLTPSVTVVHGKFRPPEMFKNADMGVAKWTTLK